MLDTGTLGTLGQICTVCHLTSKRSRICHPLSCQSASMGQLVHLFSQLHENTHHSLGQYVDKAKSSFKIISRRNLTFLRGLPLPRPLVGGVRISPSGPFACFCFI